MISQFKFPKLQVRISKYLLLVKEVNVKWSTTKNFELIYYLYESNLFMYRVINKKLGRRVFETTWKNTEKIIIAIISFIYLIKFYLWRFIKSLKWSHTWTTKHTLQISPSIQDWKIAPFSPSIYYSY